MRALILAAAVLVFSGFWVLPVSDPSEARYAEVAREMAAGGDWLVPHAMGKPHLTKPPLTYWAAAASIAAFGPRAWAARLPVALAFLLTVVLTADLGRRLWADPRARQGAWAGLMPALGVELSLLVGYAFQVHPCCRRLHLAGGVSGVRSTRDVPCRPSTR